MVCRFQGQEVENLWVCQQGIHQGKSSCWGLPLKTVILKTQGRAIVVSPVCRPSAFFSHVQGSQSFALLNPLTGWMTFTHIGESNLLYSKSTDLNINLIQNTQTNIWHTSGYCSPAKLTHKISYHVFLNISVLILNYVE